MADHLPLPAPTAPAERRRVGGNPDPKPVRASRSQHATTLRGRLEGLGLPYGPSSSAVPPPEDEDEVDPRIVLVFSGRTPLKTGPFRGWNMTPLAETDEKGMAVLTAEESRRLFARLVEEYGGDEEDWNETEAWRTQLDAIEGVRLYDRQDRLDPDLEECLPSSARIVVDVSIWPSTLERPRSAQRVVDQRIQELEAVVGAGAQRDPANRIAAKDPRPETPMLRVAADAELLGELLTHALVERVALPKKADIAIADLADAQPPSSPIGYEGAPIGVIDDLVMDNPYLDGVVAGRAAFPEDFPWQPPTQHGTQVAGIAAYGGLRPLTSDPTGLSPPHPIYSARILHADPHNSDRATVAGLFHFELEQAIRWLADQGVKVINLSVTDDVPSSRAQPGETTTVVDTLARELDLVIVVSSGNRDVLESGHWRDDYPAYLVDPAARIAEPGNAALAVTTGAISWYADPGGPHAQNRVGIAGARQAAPFTRVGPARGATPRGTLKPEFVGHGGNWAWDEQLGLITNDPALSVITLVSPARTNGRLIGAVNGTSFAAPYVAHEAATIATRYPDAGANLIRCLLALSTADTAAQMQLPRHVAAYGLPRASTILESGPHRVVLTFEGQIPPNHTVVHPIPVPDGFARGKVGQQITLALAFDPPVRRTRRAYQAATMEAELVRNMHLEEVVATYREQPTIRAAAGDATLERRDLPKGHRRPALEPNSQAIESNTLIRRQSRTTSWDPDDDGYFLVVRHNLQNWVSGALKHEPQNYAVAVQLTLQDTVDIDLYARIQQMLRIRGRARGKR